MINALLRILSSLKIVKNEKNNICISNDHPLFSGSFHAEPDPGSQQ